MNEQTQTTQDARLAALYEVSSQLGKSLDLDEVLNQVMDAIIQLTGAERGILMLYDEESGQLAVRAARNVDKESIEGEAMNISRTVVERTIAAGKGLLTSNAQEDERFSNQQSVVGYQLRSIMCAPLQARGFTLGAVYVDNRLFSGVFQDADLDLLVTFTNQAAVAIENARLFTQTDAALARRVEELSLFQRIDQQLNKSLDLNRVLSSALNWAIALTDADGGSIGLFEHHEDEESFLRLMVLKGAEDAAEMQQISMDHPMVKQVVENGRSVLTHNVTAEDSIDGSPAAIQLTVPIHQNGETSGIISLGSHLAQRISQEDVAFVERLADRAAVAIKNAQLYEQIHAANTAKSEFVSLVAHELRLPMTSIKGYTDLMMTGMAGALNEQQTQFLEVIKRNLQRMSTLISDLSDINRIESGRMVFNNKQFNLYDIVFDVTESLSERIETRKQTIDIQVDESLPDVYADPTRITQVLTNLVSNANKYTPDEGHIEVKADAQDGFVVVSVKDNGIGISQENQEKLFTQFFRVEDQNVREQPGWGLGLSIVRKMVEAQGGEIQFQSELGTGSTFTFTVPQATDGE